MQPWTTSIFISDIEKSLKCQNVKVIYNQYVMFCNFPCHDIANIPQHKNIIGMHWHWSVFGFTNKKRLIFIGFQV